ncbi:MAG: hypothetical protein GY754_45055 [bacterium]|nr:hypothetical protein [bacterium]
MGIFNIFLFDKIIVRFISCFLVLVSAGVFFSCKAQGPLTPEDAFLALKETVRKPKGVDFAGLLSEKSNKEIARTAQMVAGMEGKQLETLAATYGVAPERLKKLSVNDFTRLYIYRKKGNVVKTAVSFTISSIDREDKRAFVHVENGMALPFVKEGPYWKLDLAGL